MTPEPILGDLVMNDLRVFSKVLHNGVGEPGRPLITASEKGDGLVLFASVSMETSARSKQSGFLFCFA